MGHYMSYNWIERNRTDLDDPADRAISIRAECILGIIPKLACTNGTMKSPFAVAPEKLRAKLY